MKRIFLLCFLFLFVVSMIIINPAFCLTINQDLSNGGHQIQANYPIGQSFTATDTDIGFVGFNLININTGSNDNSLTLTLHNGDGDFSVGSELISEVFILPNTIPNFGSEWIYMDVSSVSFVQNQMYTIGATNDSPQWGILRSPDNPYSGGVGYLNGLGEEVIDFTFRVGPNSSVPEPTTMLLLGLGLIGFAGVSRKKQ